MVRCVRPMTHLPTPQCIGENAALLIDPTPRAEDETRATSAGRVVYSFRHPLATLPGAQLKYDLSTPLTSTIPHICACLLFPSYVLNFDLYVSFLNLRFSHSANMPQWQRVRQRYLQSTQEQDMFPTRQLFVLGKPPILCCLGQPE